MAKSAIQLNSNALHFVTVYYESCRKLRIPSNRKHGLRGENERTPLSLEALTFSIVASYSEADKNGKQCYLRYEDMQSLFRASSATITRSIQNLCASDFIEQNKTDYKRTAYKIKVSPNRSKFIMIDSEMLRKEGIYIDGHFYHLSRHAIFVYSLILTNALNDDTDGIFRASTNKVANTLGISSSSAGQSLRRLIDIKAIQRDITGLNGNVESQYTIPSGLLAEERSKREKWDAEREEREERRIRRMPEYIKEIEAANWKSAREREYAARRTRAERNANFYKMKASRDAQYQKLDSEIKRLDFEIGKADAYHSPDLVELRQKQTQLLKERDKRLSRLGIKLQMLEPEYFCKCKKCSDTGFLPNGKMCDCYTPPRGKPWYT